MCVYIAYLASGAASLYIKHCSLSFFLATGGADVNSSCAAAIFVLVMAAR